jgi:hypothetical protein
MGSNPIVASVKETSLGPSFFVLAICFHGDSLTPQRACGAGWQGKGLQNPHHGFTPTGHCAIPSSPQKERADNSALLLLKSHIQNNNLQLCPVRKNIP